MMLMTTDAGPTGNETGTGPEAADGLDLAVVIGIAAALGALALLAGIIICAIWLTRRRKRKKPKEEDRPQKSIAFYQAVWAARPGHLAQNGKKYPPWPNAQNRNFRKPRVNNYRPRSIDNPVYDWHHNSADWYQPQPCYRPQQSAAY